MGRFLIVSRVERLAEHLELAEKYNVGFEINDFFDPQLLDDEKRQQVVIDRYLKAGLPEGSTMHGAFFDVTVFSNDAKIREISNLRMHQSMEIARKLHVKGVVFHTNWNPMVCGEIYENQIVERTVSYMKALLEQYPEIEIYLENMFDSDPRILTRISKELKAYKNYGVCLDYAHATIYGSDIAHWIEELTPYIKHLHINDNDLKQDQHLALGEGQIDWHRFMEYYRTRFADCSVLIETTQPENQAKSLQYLEAFSKGEIQKKIPGRVLHSEELLEKIFWYMNQLVDERGFSSTLMLLTNMGRCLVNSDRASFWYWDVKRKQYWTLAALDSEQIIVPEGSGIVGASIRNNEIILINDPYGDSRFNPEVDRKTGYKTRSILCIPVTNTQGKVIGAFQAINKMSENGTDGFDERDVNRLRLAAVYCGKTLESHLLYHEAQVDQLTGLKNRRGLYEYYSDSVRPALRNQPVSVIMCDIDFFKKVNDTYGHTAGDAVLMYIADILQRSIRGNGEVIRWGGEEFILLLPGRDLEQAVQLAEEIRTTVEVQGCPYETEEIRVTMSFGVRELDADIPADENIEYVDVKLYEAKETGRNRVVS